MSDLPDPAGQIETDPSVPDKLGADTPEVTDPATPDAAAIDQLLQNNATYVQVAAPVDLPGAPSLKVAIVTCMDCRLDPASVLGLTSGEAHVIRNAGGVVSEDVIRSLSISQHKLGTSEVMVIHHTRCGMQTITDDGFRAELQAITGMAPSFAIESFVDLDADVRQSVLRVRHSEFIPRRDAVRGFVYDVNDHSLREVLVD